MTAPAFGLPLGLLQSTKYVTLSDDTDTLSDDNVLLLADALHQHSISVAHVFKIFGSCYCPGIYIC